MDLNTLWFILVSPIDRLAFSLGTIPLLRGLLLAPALAGLFLLELRIGASYRCAAAFSIAT